MKFWLFELESFRRRRAFGFITKKKEKIKEEYSYGIRSACQSNWCSALKKSTPNWFNNKSTKWTEIRWECLSSNRSCIKSRPVWDYNIRCISYHGYISYVLIRRRMKRWVKLGEYINLRFSSESLSINRKMVLLFRVINWITFNVNPSGALILFDQ